MIKSALISKIGGAASQAGGGITQTAMGLATGIAGAVRARRARRRLNRSIDKEMRDAQQMYDRDYYGDYMARSENQSALRNLKKLYLNSNGAGSAAVTGATPTAQAVKQAAIGSNLADATANIAGNASQKRDQAMGRYITAKGRYYGAKQDLLNNQMQNAAEMARQGFKSMGEGLVNTANAFAQKK